MSSSGKTLGLVLIGAGLAIGLAIAVWAATAFADGATNRSGAVFGVALAVIFIVAPLVGGGIFILSKGRAEEQDLARVREQRALLDIVKTRGQVQVSDLVLELNSSTSAVQKMLTDLVGRGLFSGYVDWNKGVLYSVEASQLTGRHTCPNCGGQLELAGKGLIKCPYCGAEIFL